MYRYIIDNLYYYYNSFYSIKSIENTIENVEKATESVEKTIEEIKEITENIEKATEEVKEITDNVEHITENIEKATENVDEIIQTFEKAINNDEIDEYIKKIIQEMNQYYLNETNKNIE